MKLVLKSHHGTYLRADPDGTVNLTTNCQEWERWTIKKKDNYFYIKSWHDTYLRADPDGAVNLTTNCQEWERWTVKKEDNHFYIKSWHGTYIRADPDKTVNLTTNRFIWEQYKFFYIEPESLKNNTIDKLTPFYFYKNTISISSECMGIWGKVVIDYLFSKLKYNTIWKMNDDTCDIICRSFFFCSDTPSTSSNKRPCIYWSGERGQPGEIAEADKKKSILLTTTKTTNIDYVSSILYIPYFLYHPNLYQDRKFYNVNRKYLLAYCNGNCHPHRENIFNLFCRKTEGKNICHALGGCAGSYSQNKRAGAEGHWFAQQDELISLCKDYKFMIAMENDKADGYITEKILNAFTSGAIPIYWGSSNINQIFNHDAFINIDNFNTPEECVDYILNMSEQEITKMANQPIYTNDNLANLMNDQYNNNNNNIVLSTYLDKFKILLS